MTLKIRHKVILPALAVIVILLAPAAYSVYSIYQINIQTRYLSTHDFPGTLAAGRMRRLLDDVTLYGRLAATATDSQEYLDKFEMARRQFDSELELLESREVTAPTMVHESLRRHMGELYAALPSSEEDPDGLARAIEQAEASLVALEDEYSRQVQERITEVAGMGNFASQFTLYALLAGLFVSIVVWGAILVSLGRPLRELVAGTQRVAQGRFDEPIPVRGKDELGTLSDAFNRMAGSLSELDRMKADFVATASHELKTPLACIRGFASLLKSGSKGPLTDQQQATLVQVEEQVDQVTAFVSQLLDLSRLRAGKVTMNLRPLPTEAFFSSVVRSFEGVAERKGIDYSVRLSERLPRRIQADPDRMREVVYNLLGNAFKFTGESGKVTFEADYEAGWIRVAVTDTGPGIPQEDVPFIFERYFKGGEPGSNRGQEGAGLGLAIARSIVEKHGGRIWVETGAEGGSRFVFRIPAAQVGAVRKSRNQRPRLAAKEN